MDPCLQCCHLLKRACALSEKHIGKALAGTDLNMSQAMLLVYVGDRKITSMSQLGSALCCHKSNITQIVEFLAKEKMIVRTPCVKDRRVQCIELSKKGKEIVDRLHEAMEKHAEECVTGLSKSEAQTFMELLGKYVAHTEGIACACGSD